MLSVVIIGRNEAANLADCVASVRDALAQDGIPHQVVYVDSASTDGSLAVANGAEAACYTLRTVDTTAGLARRAGTQVTTGEALLFLDGDMRLMPGFCRVALDLVLAGKADGVCGIRQDVYERDGQIVGQTANYYGCTERRDAPEFGGAILLTRRALEAAGGWAAPLIACEEAELHARLRKQGSRVTELPVPMILHTDRVRENRGLLGTLCSARRLGLGQALRHALSLASAGALLRREPLAFAGWILDMASIATLLAAPLSMTQVLLLLLIQGLQWVLFAQRRAAHTGIRFRAALPGALRSLLGQKLLLWYLPAGFFSYHSREEGCDPWPPAPTEA